MISAIIAWRDVNWRIRNLEDWKEAHFHTTEQALKNITMLREAVIKITQVSEGQDKRISMIEDRIDWRNARTH